MPPDRNASRGSSTAESDLAAVGAFLRALAERAERDPAFGRQIAALLDESGLLGGPHPPAPSPTKRGGARRSSLYATADAAGIPPRRGEGTGERAPATPLPDPFALLRDQGADGLRERLDTLDLAALRQIIRAHRLDPARISARWTTRERLVALIVDQVRARADHGKAFAHV